MGENPLVTIGIPFLNPGPYFLQAVKSVFAQTYPHWELILVDDGSTDGTLELARAIRDPRVRVVSDGKSLGLPTRLNQISRMARGTYVARMDADDVMHPMRIERQVAFLQKHPEVDVLGTGVFFLDEKGAVVGLKSFTLPANVRESLRRLWLVHASLLAKRAWFLQNPYNTEYKRGEERELFLRTFNKTKFGLLNEPLYGWRLVGVRSISKYLSTFKYERKMLIEHGPELLGWPGTMSFLLRSLIKSLLAIVLFASGKENLVYRKAVGPVPPGQKQYLLDALKQIDAQEVPGW